MGVAWVLASVGKEMCVQVEVFVICAELGVERWKGGEEKCSGGLGSSGCVSDTHAPQPWRCFMLSLSLHSVTYGRNWTGWGGGLPCVNRKWCVQL